MQDEQKRRDAYKEQLKKAAIAHLLGETEYAFAHQDEEKHHVSSVAFIVRIVAKNLELPVEPIQLSESIAEKMDTSQQLHRLMQKGNIQIRQVKLTGNWYEKDSGHFIGYYGPQQELAAIIAEKPGKYRIITATMPEGIPLTEESKKLLHDFAYACYGGLPRRRLGTREFLRFMWRSGLTIDYTTVIVMSILAGIIPVATPIITETIFRDIIPMQDRQGLAAVTQVLVVSGFTAAALSFIRSIALFRLMMHLDMKTGAALWGRLLSLPLSFFRQFSSGDLAMRMRGVESIETLLGAPMMGGILGFLASFWTLLIMAYYSLKLTATALLLWIIQFLVSILIYRNMTKIKRSLIDSANQTVGLVQQIFSAVAKFRTQGAEERAFYLWSRLFGKECNWRLRLRWQQNYITIITAIQPIGLTLLLYVVVAYGLGINQVSGEEKSGIEYATFIAFVAAYTGFNQTFNQALPLIGELFSVRPYIEKLMPIFESEPETTEDKADAPALTGDIELSHVSFAYTKDGSEVLRDISLHIKRGEKVAFVGKSGSGKSTIVRLLLGFEKAKAGAIFFDGRDLSTMDLTSVRSQLGVVLQNGQLMTGDIFMNIAGVRKLSEKEIWEAAERAGIAEDIKNMPMGLQTFISEGSGTISGGQRQRILIARALAAKPAILIFDEATAALDNRTQAIVTESLSKLPITQIIVAHRLSTIRNVDRIFVLDKGVIMEEGSFDELVERKGLFSQLVGRQMM